MLQTEEERGSVRHFQIKLWSLRESICEFKSGFGKAWSLFGMRRAPISLSLSHPNCPFYAHFFGFATFGGGRVGCANFRLRILRRTHRNGRFGRRTLLNVISCVSSRGGSAESSAAPASAGDISRARPIRVKATSPHPHFALGGGGGGRAEYGSIDGKSF